MNTPLAIALLCFAIGGAIILFLLWRWARRATRISDTLDGMADWGGML